MTDVLDHFGINHMTTAISQEMDRSACKTRSTCDTVFFGGAAPGSDQQIELAQFGLRKNWRIIFASFDPGEVMRGPTSFHVVVTDGISETMVLQDGRLWKKDRRSQAILVFVQAGITVSVSSKGRLMAKPIGRPHHDHGYDLALQAVMQRVAREPGRAPVVSSIGTLQTVYDIRTLSQVFANAE